MGLHHIQNVHNSGAFFQIDDIMPLSLYHTGLQPEASDHFLQLHSLGPGSAYDLEMIGFVGIAHGSRCQICSPDERPLAAAALDHPVIDKRKVLPDLSRLIYQLCRL